VDMRRLRADERSRFGFPARWEQATSTSPGSARPRRIRGRDGPFALAPQPAEPLRLGEGRRPCRGRRCRHQRGSGGSATSVGGQTQHSAGSRRALRLETPHVSSATIDACSNGLKEGVTNMSGLRDLKARLLGLYWLVVGLIGVGQPIVDRRSMFGVDPTNDPYSLDYDPRQAQSRAGAHDSRR
jgi:hypothetical protein